MIGPGHGRISARGAAGWAALCIALGSHAAVAQTDVRMIRPDVMLLLDTSGSMEWRNNVLNSTCIGADGGACNLCSNGVPLCDPACPVAERQNRWATALQVLTGTIPNYSCVAINRTDPTIYTYDYLYPLQWHEPLSAGYPLWDTHAQAQASDGILDAYASQVRFGIMTFDNDPRPGIHATDGLFSYAQDRQFEASGCLTPTTVNLGSRRASIDNNVTDIVPGGLVSVGSPSADSVTMAAINVNVQNSITGTPNTAPALPTYGVRPYGGTPVAGMLEDALYYWTTNPDVTPPLGASGDPYYNCRSRYNILITDGSPNMDYRPSCVGGICPYAPPDQTAMTMASGGSGPGVKTYVIAFNATDPGAVAALTPIALGGGSGSVLFASDHAGLETALSNVLNTISTATTTRTAPAFGSSSSGTTNATLYEFQSSFQVNAGVPWVGVLQRQRSTCQGTPPVPVDQPIVQTQDDFGYLLQTSQRAAAGFGQRKLWTWMPSGATVASLTHSMAWNATQPTRVNLDSSLSPTLFNYTTATQRDTLLAWLRGDATDPYRATRPLGDIYHSNPLVWNAPTTSLPDQTYAAYRQLALNVGGWRTVAKTVGTRENVTYVGTNDGVLHAFNVDTGEEIWGFVPPYLVPGLAAEYPANHQYGVDGTPIAREMVYTRSATSIGSGTSWHSILVVGLRGGGGAYIALDVTDPYNPAFLWQFTDANMADAYGTPALATIFTNWNNGGAAQERAVAIIPGGQGTPSAAACTPMLGARPALASSDARVGVTGPIGAPRATVRCWQGTTGQYLYVLDVQTGAVITQFGPTGSPLVGSVGLYLGTPGADSTRAYVGDADGDMWRLDLSDPTPSHWKFSLLFDTFWDGSQMTGQPLVSAPVISQAANGNVYVVVGSGDPDLLEGTDSNRIAVYQETDTADSSGVISSIRANNLWQISVGADQANGDLYAGERLTGALSLFNGSLYFGTFVPVSSSDACQMGFSRLWGVSLSSVTGTRPDPELNPSGDPSMSASNVRVTRDLNGDGNLAEDLNSVLYGVGIVRRPTCVTLASTADPYVGGTHQFVNYTGGGDFRLVIQTGRGGVSSGGALTNVTSRPLPSPILQTHVNSWAVVFE